MSCTRVALIVMAFCGVLPVAACGHGSRPMIETPEVPAGWQELPQSPLGPRQAVLGLWTGSEVLVVGGSNAPPCPPSASCAADPSPLSDGAAFDPDTNRWRTIAESPTPLSWAQGVVIGSAAFVLPSPRRDSRAELLVYRIDRDVWETMAVPFDPGAGYALVAAGERLVAYRDSHENGPGSDYVLDPRAGKWAALPAAPLGAGFNRAMAWTGSELLLFDHQLVANPGAERPSFTRAAALDLTTRSWRRLPDSEILSTSPWIVVGDELVNPTLGGADGGEVGNWGRTYPNGGVLAPGTGQWSSLPKPPSGEIAGAGVHTATSAVYLGSNGVVLDATTGVWQRVPAAPGGNVTGRTVVAAGTGMFVFGGARWGTSSTEATLMRDAWIWSPVG